MTIGNVVLTTNNTGVDQGFLLKYDNTGAIKWGKTTVGPNYEYVMDIKAYNDKLYTAGYYNTSMFLGDTTLRSSSSSQGYVARYSADGVCEHADNLGSTNAYATRVSVDNNGKCILFGQFSNPYTFGNNTYISTGKDLFLLKYPMK